MPTKQPGNTTPLSPAWRFYLMTGGWAPRRIAGWVALAQVPPADESRRVREAWAEHGDALQQEASAAGFVPWAATRKRPRGAAVEAWARRFLSEHAY